jgi:hypothetical protein
MPGVRIYRILLVVYSGRMGLEGVTMPVEVTSERWDNQPASKLIDPVQEEMRVKRTPRDQITIDDVVSHLLNDSKFFGYGDDTKRQYRLDMYSDVRTRRMITAITESHAPSTLDRPSVLYLTIQHGSYMEYADNAKDISEISRLLDIIKLSGNADLKDECDSMPTSTIRMKYNGQKRCKVNFTRPAEQGIKGDVELRGVSESTYLIVCSAYSGKTSKSVPPESLEYCDWIIKQYKFKLADRIVNLQRLVDRTNA